MRVRILALALATLGCAIPASVPAQAPEAAPGEVIAVLTAARIHTLDPAQPQATALAWDAEGRIVAVGKAAELRRRFPQARHVDAGKGTVVPGLIDAQAHVMGLGQALMSADLTGAGSKAEIVERLRAFAATIPEGAWIVGRGWDQNRWPEQAFPTAADLDAAFPDRPVWLVRVDGHAGWA